MSICMYGVDKIKLTKFSCNGTSTDETIWMELHCANESRLETTVRIKPTIFIKEMREALDRMETALIENSRFEYMVENVATTEAQADRV